MYLEQKRVEVGRRTDDDGDDGDGDGDEGKEESGDERQDERQDERGGERQWSAVVGCGWRSSLAVIVGSHRAPPPKPHLQHGVTEHQVDLLHEVVFVSVPGLVLGGREGEGECSRPPPARERWLVIHSLGREACRTLPKAAVGLVGFRS